MQGEPADSIELNLLSRLTNHFDPINRSSAFSLVCITSRPPLAPSCCLPRPSATCEAEGPSRHHDMRSCSSCHLDPRTQIYARKGKGTYFPSRHSRHVHFLLFIFGGTRAIAFDPARNFCKAKANGVRPRRHPSPIPATHHSALSRCSRAELEQEQASEQEHNRSRIPAAARTPRTNLRPGPSPFGLVRSGEAWRPKPLGSSPRGLEGV